MYDDDKRDEKIEKNREHEGVACKKKIQFVAVDSCAVRRQQVKRSIKGGTMRPANVSPVHLYAHKGTTVLDVTVEYFFELSPQTRSYVTNRLIGAIKTRISRTV